MIAPARPRAEPLARNWRAWAAALLLFMLFSRISDLPAFDRLPISPNQLLVGLLLSLLVFDRLRGRRPLVWDRLIGWMLLYALAVGLSTLGAFNGISTLAALVACLRDVVIALSVLNLVRRGADFQVVSWGLIAAGLLLVVAELIDAATGFSLGGLSTSEYAHLAYGTYGQLYGGSVGDSNSFAQLLVPLVAVALVQVWTEPRRPWRWLAGFAVALLTLGLVLTYSRGGLLALLTVVGLVALRQRRQPRRLLALTLVLLPLVFAPPTYHERLLATAEWISLRLHPATTGAVVATPTQLPGSLAAATPVGTIAPAAPTVPTATSLSAATTPPAPEPDYGSLYERSVIWQVGFQMFLDRPLTGIGKGNYYAAYFDYVDAVAADLGYLKPRGAHSTPVQVLAETGLLGLLTFGGVVVIGLLGLQQAQRALGARERLAALGLEGFELGAYGFLVTALFLNNNFPRYLWILLALGAAGRQLALREAARSVSAEQSRAL
jgi:O-antigen ligase/polysaccharide polymerase Wzy-like membrane protein